MASGSVTAAFTQGLRAPSAYLVPGFQNVLSDLGTRALAETATQNTAVLGSMVPSTVQAAGAVKQADIQRDQALKDRLFAEVGASNRAILQAADNAQARRADISARLFQNLGNIGGMFESSGGAAAQAPSALENAYRQQVFQNHLLKAAQDNPLMQQYFQVLASGMRSGGS